VKKVLLFLLFICSLSAAFAESPEGAFNSSSENGLTGIFETPTARIMDENTFRVFYNQSKPYRNYGVGVSLYDRLELSGRFTEIIGADMTESDSEYWGDYGDYKDKFIAGKFRVRKESKYLPEIAVGLSDPQGTKLFGAQYFVMSKQIYPFDFSFGMGLGRYGDKAFRKYGQKDVLTNFVNLKEYYNNGNPFFSVNFRPSDKYAIVYEYNPIDYESRTEDPAVRRGLVGTDSKHSIGIRYFAHDNLYFTLSYQRGEQVGFGVTMPFRIGEPVVPIYNQQPIFSESEKNSGLYPKLYAVLAKNGFTDIRILIQKDKASISAQNNKFFYEQDAVEAIARSLNDIDTSELDNINIIVSHDGVQLYNFTLNRDLVTLYSNDRITGDELYAYSKLNTEYKSTRLLEMTPRLSRINSFSGFKPQFNFYLNDPSGFFKGSYGVKGWAGYTLSNNVTFVGGAAFYPFNDISSINDSEDEAIRSDIAEYIDKKVLLDMMLADYKARIPDTDVYYNLEGGILETQFAGINAEVGVPFFNNNFILGLSGTVVRKRDKDEYLGIQNDKNYETAFVKTRIHFRSINTFVDVDAGRFLGTDVGAKVKITKNINGVELSAWYTKTDTSVFHADFNRGYSDKGIMVSVPIRLFKGKESRSTYAQSISPWTRDVGAQVSEFTNIFDVIDRRYSK